MLRFSQNCRLLQAVWLKTLHVRTYFFQFFMNLYFYLLLLLSPKSYLLCVSRCFIFIISSMEYRICISNTVYIYITMVTIDNVRRTTGQEFRVCTQLFHTFAKMLIVLQKGTKNQCQFAIVSIYFLRYCWKEVAKIQGGFVFANISYAILYFRKICVLYIYVNILKKQNPILLISYVTFFATAVIFDVVQHLKSFAVQTYFFVVRHIFCTNAVCIHYTSIQVTSSQLTCRNFCLKLRVKRVTFFWWVGDWA